MKVSFVTTAIGMRDGARAWDLPTFVRECQVAEDAGFVAAYTGERRGRGPASGETGVLYNPDLLCMYGLSHTSSMIFGTHITLLPLHHPVRVAQDAAIVNAMYPGRYRLGIGAGYTEDDFRAFGVPLSERAERMRVGLEAINAFRHGRPYTLTGPYQGEVPELDPAIPGDPVEVYVGAWSRAGVRRAARYGDGYYTGPIRTVTAEAELAELYRAECAKLGKTPRVVLMREAGIALTDEAAVAMHGDFLLRYSKLYFSRGGTYEEKYEPWVNQVSGVDEITLDMTRPDRYLCGSVDTWLETIESWKKIIDPDELMIRLRYFYGPDPEKVMDELRLVGKHVIPVV